MIIDPFKTGIRFLLKNKTFSFINIFGLAFGTLSCLYILLFIHDQYSFDRHHKDVLDIYRITTSLNMTGDRHLMATASPPIAPAMKNDFPEVKQFTRVVGSIGVDQHLIRYKNKAIYEKEILFVDSTFFEIFSYHFVGPHREDLLSQPYSIVLNKGLADKIFGKEDPVGKRIELDNAYGKHDFAVTAVVDESLGKSHIQANLFITMNSGGIGEYVRQNTTWSGNNFTSSYIKLVPGTHAEDLASKLPAFLKKYGEQQFKAVGMEKQLLLQPVSSIHTTDKYDVEMSKPVSPGFLNILLLIAVLIQVIACINFMNLSTARASKRAKEVGVRKVVGAERKSLIRQFLGESFLVSLAGVLMALPLLWLFLPYLNRITEADIQLTRLQEPALWLMLAGIVAGTGLIAGSYPAFYLSAFQAIKVMKGNFTSHISVAGIRRSLVVFQFVLSIVLITGIIVIYFQLNYINHRDLGFDKNQKLVFSYYTEDTKAKMLSFSKDLQQLPEVKSSSMSNNYLSQFVFNDHGVYLSGGDMAHATDAQNMTTDEKFAAVNGIRIISGRDFRQNDSGRALVNETLLRRLGLSAEKAPGTRLYTNEPPDPPHYVEIAGVMKDFNYNSLHGQIKPFMLFYSSQAGDFSHLTVSVSSPDYTKVLAQIKPVWEKNFSNTPFQFAFLDEEVQKQYVSEIRLSRIIDTFTGIAILISCLGLFGLVAFSAEQRKKEISIRKVLGSSTTGIMRLLSVDLLKLVMISILIASPIAWWAMSRWLRIFEYRIDISWWMFALAGLFALILALATLILQSWRAAVSNPVRSLRSE
jgi:putative ABC transport system permease protein